MSVYRPKTKTKDGKEAPGRFWAYDFRIEGRRFHGSTGQTSRRAAEQFEERKRRQVAAGEIDDGQPAEDFAAMSLDDAAEQWWQDVGQHLRSAPQLEGRIGIVLRLLGGQTPIGDIRTAHVNAAIQARRQERSRHGKPLTAASVNRDIIDTLRPILRHVDDLHEIGLPRIAWGKLRLREDTVIEREFSEAEIAAWGAELGVIERFFLGFALTYGPRFGELFFPLDALREGAEGPELVIHRYKGREGWMPSRKDGSAVILPLEPDHARGLGQLIGRASAAGLETAWFDEHPSSGRLSEISYWAMHNRLRAAAAAAGVKPGRLIHGMRHHAGTALMRATGNLLTTQRLLGHKRVTTTQRYAHVRKADVRDGIAAASRNSPETRALASPKPVENKGD